MHVLSHVAFLNTSADNAFGFTLYKRDRSNSLFVAETDNYSNITRFVPIIEIEHLLLTEYNNSKSYSVGDAAPIVCRTNVYGLVCEAIEFYLSNFRLGDFSGFPSFQMHLSRILGLTGADHREVAQSVANEIFRAESIRDNWLNVELNAGFRDESFWRSYMRRETPWSQVAKELDLTSFDEMLFWLREHSNFEDPRWGQIWRVARSTSPFDEGLAIVSKEWGDVYGPLVPNEKDSERLKLTFEVTRHVLQSTMADKYIVDSAETFKVIFDNYPETIYYYADSRVAINRLREMFFLLGEVDASNRIEKVAGMRNML